MLHRIIGIGHSHLICFDDAAEDLLSTTPGRFDYVPICFLRREYHPPFVVRAAANTPILGGWMSWLTRYGTPMPRSCWPCPGRSGGTGSLTPGPESFDFVDPAHDDGAPLCGQVISYDLMMNKARVSVQYVRLVVDGVRSVSDVPIFLSPPPPPMLDVASLFAEHALDRPAAGQKHGGLRHILKQLTPTIEQYGLSTDSFLVKA